MTTGGTSSDFERPELQRHQAAAWCARNVARCKYCGPLSYGNASEIGRKTYPLFRGNGYSASSAELTAPIASLSLALASALHCCGDAEGWVPNAVAVLAGRYSMALPLRGSIIARAVTMQTLPSSNPPS